MRECSAGKAGVLSAGLVLKFPLLTEEVVVQGKSSSDGAAKTKGPRGGNAWNILE